MNKRQKFFKGKLYKSVRGNFFEEETYENTDRKNLKGKSNFFISYKSTRPSGTGR
ncbi:hypothetical protein [Thermoanaerobacter thermocopriae]|uniref:hypothetical protein n=1 Tax=Thermoanaerobacter thermocopriae TaxID=29350 RepID=UPI000AAC1506|nr:hypothetical protein [Thermoanaerobacter thermocopriae]